MFDFAPHCVIASTVNEINVMNMIKFALCLTVFSGGFSTTSRVLIVFFRPAIAAQTYKTLKMGSQGEVR